MQKLARNAMYFVFKVISKKESRLIENTLNATSRLTLVSLLFDHCKSIKNHDYVIQLQHLNTLAYNDAGALLSIKFIRKIKSLKSFRFVGTDVVDGDITPCIGLEYAGFSNKKHFSHTMQQIRSLSIV